MQPAIKTAIPTAEAVSRLLHPHGEVVIHDIKANKIAAIFNPFSKRQVGDDSLLSDEERMASLEDCIGPYPNTNWDGRGLKSVSSVIRDQRGTAVALLCINLDISAMTHLQEIIAQFIKPSELQAQPEPLFADDWQSRVNQYVQQYLANHQLSLATLTRAQKKRFSFAFATSRWVCG